jgi:hypothetical protein
VNLVGTCRPQRVTRSDVGLHGLKHLQKGIVKRMMDILGINLESLEVLYIHLFCGNVQEVTDVVKSSGC